MVVCCAPGCGVEARYLALKRSKHSAKLPGPLCHPHYKVAFNRLTRGEPGQRGPKADRTPETMERRRARRVERGRLRTARNRVEGKRKPAEMVRMEYLRRMYGLSPAEYAASLARQGGVCAICGSPPPVSGRVRFLDVDHCHASGAVRGLLCARCNKMLGYARDNPVILRAAIAYLG